MNIYVISTGDGVQVKIILKGNPYNFTFWLIIIRFRLLSSMVTVKTNTAGLNMVYTCSYMNDVFIVMRQNIYFKLISMTNESIIAA